MALWKKSEDPWDRKPGESASRSEEVPAEVPDCPWCGEPMALRYLCCGRDGAFLYETKPTPVLGHPATAGRSVTRHGLVNNYTECWFCETCEKLVVDVPPIPRSPFEDYEKQMKAAQEDVKDMKTV